MANRRFIDFPIATTVGDSDIILIWQSGVNKQTTKATFLSGLPENLDELNDVAISGLTNGQILRYDSVTGKWENTDQGNLDLNDLNDVSIVSPSNGQVLVYNSSTSKWENSSGGFVPYTGAVTTVNLGAQTIQAGQFVKAGGTSSQFLKADGSIDSTAYGTGSVTSVGLTMPSAFSVANSPVTTAGTLAVTGAGTVSQYIRGDGSLADFPESSGGGSSVSYYLNGSVNQGTIGGVAYRELSKIPVLGAGTDFSINANGYVASFITDAGDPSLLEIPGGNWNFETYFSASSGGGSPTFYVELYKVNSGGTATLIASSSSAPELIAFGTNITAYFSSLAVPTTTLALTDRLAVRYYVTHSGRTITLHTEDNHLCQIITTFTTGLTALNGLTAQVQNFAVGTSGSDFNISSATATHTFNLPTASGTNRGALSSADWTTFNNKENAITAGTTAQYFRGDKTFQTLNTSVVPELTNLYYTEARVNANANVAANTAARHNAVTLGTANGLSLSTQVLSLGLASAGVTGALSGTDWTTFNSKQNALTNPVTGTGAAGRVAYWNGSGTITSDSLFQWNDFSKRLGIGRTPTVSLDVEGAGFFSGTVTASSIIKSGGTSSQYLMADGSVSTLTNPVTGTGTTNYLPKFTGTSTIGNSQIFDNGTNVGIGTASPNARLELTSNSPSSAEVQRWSYNNGNADFSLRLKQEVTSGLVTHVFDLVNNGTTYSNNLVLTNGNIGISVIPSSWASNYKAIQISSFAALSQGGNDTYLGNNWFNDGSNKYLQTSGASIYGQSNGSHFWLTAPSGTAGNAISFTQAMTLDASGNLLIGATSNISSARREIVIRGANGSLLSLGNNTTADRFQIVSDSGENALLNNKASTPMIFYTSNTERARFTSGGNLLVGTTTDTGERLQVSGNIRTNSGYIQIRNSSNPSLYINNGSAQWQQFVNSGNHLVFSDAINNVLTLGYNGSASYFQGGNVGIGTNSPMGFGGFTNLTIGSTATNNQSAIFLVNSSVSIRGSWYQNAGTQINFGTATSHPLVFDTNDTERMRITSSGNVGIGTTSPDSQLTLNGSSNSRLNMRAGDTRYGTLYADNGVFAVASITAIPLVLGTNDIERMRITSGGNVGIGTTSPNSRLHIAGDFRTVLTSGVGGDTLIAAISGVSNGYIINVDTSNNITHTWNTGANAAALRITPSGNVLIGTTTDSGQRLQINGVVRVLDGNNLTVMQPGNGNGSNIRSVTNGDFRVTTGGTPDAFVIANAGAATFSSLGTGTVYSNGGTLTNTNPSDFNLKENIAPINYGLSEILQLNAVTFNWKNDTINQGKQYGFIAQEVQKIMPDLVKKGEYLGLDKEAIFTTLVKAIQELKQEIDTLKN